MVLLVSADMPWTEEIRRICGRLGLSLEVREDFVAATETLMAGTDYAAYVLDMGMDRRGCLAFIRLLNELKTHPRIFVFGRSEEGTDGRDARAEGITLFFDKSSETGRLEEALAAEGTQRRHPPFLS